MKHHRDRMPETLRLPALFCLTVLMASGPAIAGSPPDSFDTLVERIDRTRQARDVAGFGLAVVEDGRIRIAVGGLADRASGRRVMPDTRFRIGSVTKVFNALVVMMLDEAGQISLDTPLRDIVSDIQLTNPWADAYPVRIVHLLEHTAGLMDLTQAEFALNERFDPIEDALGYSAESRRVHWPPGMHRSYSNVGAGYLTLALERSTGQKWQTLIKKRLFEPLGMSGARAAPDEDGKLATGYDTDGSTVIPYWHMIFPALGGIDATPIDMGAVLQLMIGRGRYRGNRLLSEASVRRMERPTTTLAARSGLDYGYGPGLDQFIHGEFRFYGHTGDGDGYLSRFAYQPALGVGYFVTINAFQRDTVRVMADRIAAYLVRDRHPPAAPQPIELPAARLKALVGRYEKVTRRFEWERKGADKLVVGLEDGRLTLDYTSGRRIPLLAVNENHFRHPREPVATMAFVRYVSELYLQGDFGSYRRIKD